MRHFPLKFSLCVHTILGSGDDDAAGTVAIIAVAADGMGRLEEHSTASRAAIRSNSSKDDVLDGAVLHRENSKVGAVVDIRGDMVRVLSTFEAYSTIGQL